MRFLKGIGPARADALEAAGLSTCYDLLQYYPRRHLDRTNTLLINEALGDDKPVTIVGTVRVCGITGFRKSKRFEAIIEDARGDRVSCVWFRRTKWISSVFQIGDRIALHGRVRAYRGKPSMSHPDFDKLDSDGPSLDTGRIVSLYRGSALFEKVGLTSRTFRRAIYGLIKERGVEFPEVLPQWIIDQHDLLDGRVALRAIHFPKNRDELAAARRRLVFEELFFIQLLMAQTRQSRSVEPAAAFDAPGFHASRFLANLPFELTAGQRRVIGEIARDTQRGVQMNRLLQGDVGSGKTIIAVAAMLQAVDSGFQAAFLAPTEILAEQHFSNLRNYFDFLDVSMRLLVGGQKAAHRREVLHDIA
ncbi:MAG: DEAD/DEAH box helicase, partial [Rhodothermales bacterium]|nr:DEAD/DEAH box helicase [Rhodothermales bacterium]